MRHARLWSLLSLLMWMPAPSATAEEWDIRLDDLLTDEHIQNLPVTGRKWQDLAILAPGAVPDEFENGFDPATTPVGAISFGASQGPGAKKDVAIASANKLYVGRVEDGAQFYDLSTVLDQKAYGDFDLSTSVGMLAHGDFNGDGRDELLVVNRLGLHFFQNPIVDPHVKKHLPFGLPAGIALDPALKLVGAAISGNRNGDKYDDLLLALPDAKVNGVARAGVVLQYLGGPNGLASLVSRVYRRGASNVPGKPVAGERVGASLALVNFDNKGVDNLMLGCPFCNNRGGAVYLERNDKTFLEQKLSTPGSFFGWAIRGANLNADAFPDIVIGAPGVDQATIKNTGAFYAYLGTATTPVYYGAKGAPMALLGQTTPLGLGAGIRAFDAIGSTTDQIFLGAPCFDLPGKKDAGAVVPMLVTGGAFAPFHLDRPGVPGDAHAGEFLNVPNPSTALSTDQVLLDLCAGK